MEGEGKRHPALVFGELNRIGHIEGQHPVVKLVHQKVRGPPLADLIQVLFSVLHQFWELAKVMVHVHHVDDDGRYRVSHWVQLRGDAGLHILLACLLEAERAVALQVHCRDILRQSVQVLEFVQKRFGVHRLWGLQLVRYLQLFNDARGGSHVSASYAIYQLYFRVVQILVPVDDLGFNQLFQNVALLVVVVVLFDFLPDLT